MNGDPTGEKKIEHKRETGRHTQSGTNTHTHTVTYSHTKGSRRFSIRIDGMKETQRKAEDRQTSSEA